MGRRTLSAEEKERQMSDWPIKRRIADLTRQVIRRDPSAHYRHLVIQEVVWQYTRQVSRQQAIRCMGEILEGFDRLPSPSDLSYFTVRDTRDSLTAPSDLHRLLANWLMALIRQNWHGRATDRSRDEDRARYMLSGREVTVQAGG